MIRTLVTFSCMSTVAKSHYINRRFNVLKIKPQVYSDLAKRSRRTGRDRHR